MSVLLAAVAVMSTWAPVNAAFTATSATTASLAADDIDAYVPTTATATRTTTTTCQVTWTPTDPTPSQVRYDVRNTGTSTTLATNVAGTSTTVTVPTTSTPLAVGTRISTWTSTTSRATTAPCHGYPDAPTAVTASGDNKLTVAWAAPANNGGTLTSYTASAVPFGTNGATPTTCTSTHPTTTCTISPLTNGTAYTVTVRATSDIGTGPASNPITATPVNPGPTPGALLMSGRRANGDRVHTPDQVPGTWTSVATGLDHTCGIQTGTLWCWGSNNGGQLGVGDQIGRSAPTRVGGATDWVLVDASPLRNSCGIRQGGTLWCWGNNADGQLGTGTETQSLVPIPVSVSPSQTWATVSLGWDHTCAITTGGTLWCWGLGDFGEVGLVGGPGQTSTPTQVGEDSDWQSVTAGEEHTCAIRDGSLYCWGWNISGQLGLGDTTQRNLPVQVGAAPSPIDGLPIIWTKVVAGLEHTCATRTDSSLWCWGLNDVGQALAAGGNQTSPAQVDGTGSVGIKTVGLGLGDDHTCYIAGDGTMRCAGLSGAGQLGRGDNASSTNPLVAGTTWTSVAGGGRHTCGTKSDNTLWCWGRTTLGQLGLPDLTTTFSQLGAATTYTSVSAGVAHGCATRTDGTLWCWGSNNESRLGLGDTANRRSATRVGTNATWTQVAAGTGHTCAVRTTGTLWCWGRNGNAQLGQGINDTTTRTTPTQVGVATTWRSVATGGEHTCATRTDNTLWCWGFSSNGQLGTGNTQTQMTPVQVGTETTWNAVSTGEFHTCATRTDRSLWCWGNNGNGRLGLGVGDVTDRNTPTQVGTGTDWAGVDAGMGHTCATRTVGTLWCWGDGNGGRLGLGNDDQQFTPQQIGTDSTWTGVTAGSMHTCATRTSGALWCWGSGGEGRLGLGDTNLRNTPTEVPGLTTVKHVDAGGDLTLVIR